MTGKQSPREPRLPPPEEPPWTLPWNEAPLAFVDLEMTGLKVESDRVLQVCIERVVDGELVDQLLSFVRPPDGQVGPHQAIHGISLADVAEAPAFAELIPRIDTLLDGAIFVAHAARHDLEFLRAEYARAERECTCSHYLDTLALSRRAFSAPSHRLHTLAARLGIEVGRAHRADSDVAVLRQLFDRTAGTLRATTPRELWALQTSRRVASPHILEQAKQAASAGKAVWLSYRPASRSVQRFRFHVTAVLTDLDPPVVLGYLQHTRGRRQLRANRIVRIESDDDSQNAP